MRILFTVLLTIGVGIGVLRSDLTPWCIVNKADLVAKAPVPVPVQRRIVLPAAPKEDHSGDWMRDPDYRSALEKTTIVGRPEGAAVRDQGKAKPTPPKKP